jgi:deoxyribose-phosphate aldolase
LSADDRDVERLVELITERVRARMGGAPAGSAREGCCSADGDATCSTCGLCTIKRPWAVRAIQDAGASRIAAGPGVGAGSPHADLASMIDHTLLKADATREQVKKLCEEARQHKFASVCVNTTWVPVAKTLLRGSGVMVCCVVGFPLGAMSPAAKAFEAREAVRQGADEVDMVVNLGALKSRDYETVYEDIVRVVKGSHPSRVKVILETGALNQEEKIIGCTLSKLAGAAFVKTSTGFGPGGATVEDIALMRRCVGAEMGVKASGGVRTREDAEKMAAAGASRIGASASVSIVNTKPGEKSEKRAAGGGY